MVLYYSTNFHFNMTMNSFRVIDRGHSPLLRHPPGTLPGTLPGPGTLEKPGPDKAKWIKIWSKIYQQYYSFICIITDESFCTKREKRRERS